MRRIVRYRNPGESEREERDESESVDFAKLAAFGFLAWLAWEMFRGCGGSIQTLLPIYSGQLCVSGAPLCLTAIPSNPTGVVTFPDGSTAPASCLTTASDPNCNWYVQYRGGVYELSPQDQNGNFIASAVG